MPKDNHILNRPLLTGTGGVQVRSLSISSIHTEDVNIRRCILHEVRTMDKLYNFYNNYEPHDLLYATH